MREMTPRTVSLGCQVRSIGVSVRHDHSFQEPERQSTSSSSDGRDRIAQFFEPRTLRVEFSCTLLH